MPSCSSGHQPLRGEMEYRGLGQRAVSFLSTYKASLEGTGRKTRTYLMYIQEIKAMKGALDLVRAGVSAVTRSACPVASRDRRRRHC